jgi:tRNA A37 threonylcarbamoyladenosine synthetase subunit TsaC/SUA5/YrdC
MMQAILRDQEPSGQALHEDALQCFRIMKAGGVAVLPLSVSYAIFAHTASGVERIFALKQRPQSKPNGVIGNLDIFREVLQATPRDCDLVNCIVRDHDLPLSVIAPFHTGHDWLRTVEYGALRRATKGNTMDLLLNAGPLHNALARMSWESASPLMGSSANVSLTGSKFKLSDVQDSLKQGCDIVLDYGTSRYANPYSIGSTIIELPSWKVLRWGGCFDTQSELVRKHFKIDLPPRPMDGRLSLV